MQDTPLTRAPKKLSSELVFINDDLVIVRLWIPLWTVWSVSWTNEEILYTNHLVSYTCVEWTPLWLHNVTPTQGPIDRILATPQKLISKLSLRNTSLQNVYAPTASNPDTHHHDIGSEPAIPYTTSMSSARKRQHQRRNKHPTKPTSSSLRPLLVARHWSLMQRVMEF